LDCEVDKRKSGPHLRLLANVNPAPTRPTSQFGPLISHDQQRCLSMADKMSLVAEATSGDPRPTMDKPQRNHGPPGPRGSAQPRALAAHHQRPSRVEVYLTDIRRAVEAQTAVMAGREPNEEWLYLEGAGPSRWLKVVVIFDSESRGRIITSFARRRKP
jgi:hypothetical protein